MKLGKKIVAAVLAAATALTALSVSAFAADVIGTNPTPLKDGIQVTVQIPYDESNNLDNGHNYADFKFSAPASGKIKIAYDISCNTTVISCYRADNMKQLSNTGHKATNGKITNDISMWNSSASIFAGVKYYSVEKGDYFIRVRRYISNDSSMTACTYGNGKKGNGRLHITVEMVKPDAPKDIKVIEKTDTTLKLQWKEPDTAAYYDLRYKASGESEWNTISEIMDNNVVIKDLQSTTKYTYQMRSISANGIVGNWGKAASAKTTDPKDVTFEEPTLENAVTLNWNTVDKATSYKVRYSTDKKKWKNVTAKENFCKITITPGKTYYYQVAAKNSAVTGPWSKIQSIKLG